MDLSKGYVYLGSSDDFKYSLYTKIGKCNNIKNRLDTYNTSFPHYGFSPYMIIVCPSLNFSNDIEKILHKYLIDDNLWNLNDKDKDKYFNGGIEWFNNQYSSDDIKYILDDYNYEYNILEGVELEKFIEKEKRINYKNQQKYYEEYINFNGDKKEEIEENKVYKKKYNKRQYQIDIINYCYVILNNIHKIYLELATGGGKTYIMFKIFQHINPNFIVIFSPRKKINKQNTNKDYLSILDDKYKILNYSESNKEERKDFFKSKEKRILVSCSQSSKKIYNFITKYNIKNIFVWFDEAHWSVGEWLDKNDDEKVKKYKSEPHRKFWLEDKKYILNRMFVSASPNKDLIKINKNIYGELYNPINVKELIAQKWLCPAIPYQFAYPKTKDDINICNYIIHQFEQKKRNWGFCFHALQINAFNQFYNHFIKYKNNKTNVKPYLLVGDDFFDIFKSKNICDKIIIKTINSIFSTKFTVKNLKDKTKKKELVMKIDSLKQKYNEIKQYYKNTNNSYNERNKYSYKDIDNYQENINSIAYVVQKYSMGYDFKGIDYIIIADNKLSYKDIIQCLGRGFRSDKLGEGGRNKNKVLHIHIPAYYENTKNLNKKYSFKEIKKVLIYLLEYIGIDFETLFMNFNKYYKSNFNTGYDNKGQEEMKTQLLNLLYEANIFRKKNLKDINKFCINNKIDTIDKYKTFVLKYYHRRYEKNIYDYDGFKWKPICEALNKKYYSNIEECNTSANKINDELLLKYTEEEYDYIVQEYKWKDYHKHDKKIPPYNKLEEHYY